MNSKDLRIQPYGNIEEILYVTSLINTGKPSKLKWAYKYLENWYKRREISKLPRSIYLTYILIDSYYIKRSSDAMRFAVSKFIDITCSEVDDTNQFQHKVPMNASAKALNLFPGAIELRNRLVHGNELVPEKEVIDGVKESISWLICNFWVLQNAAIQEIIVLPKDCEILLDEYLELMKQSKILDVKVKVLPLIKDILNTFYVEMFFNVLLNERYILKSTEELVLWQPLLQFLSKENYLNLFLERIFINLDSNVADQKGLRYLCLTVLLNILKAEDRSPEVKFIVCGDVVSIIEWPNLLKLYMMQGVCDKNLDIFELLLQLHEPKFSEESKTEAFRMAQAFVNK